MPLPLPYYEPHDERMKDCPFVVILQITVGDAIGNPVHLSYAKGVSDYEDVGLALAECMFETGEDGFYEDPEIDTIDKLLAEFSQPEGWVGNTLDGMPLLRSWRVVNPPQDVIVDGLLICLANGLEYEDEESDAVFEGLAMVGAGAITHAAANANIALTASVSPEVFGAIVGEITGCDRSILTRLSASGAGGMEPLYPDFFIPTGDGDEIITTTVSYVLPASDSAGKILSMWDSVKNFTVTRNEVGMSITATAKRSDLMTILDFTYEEFSGIRMEVTDPDEAL